MHDESEVPIEGKKNNSTRFNAKEFRRREKHSDSGLKMIVLLLIGGILGGVVSYYAINIVFEGTLYRIETDKNSYSDEYLTISDEYRNLFEDYNALVQDKKTLEGLVNSLYSEKKVLEENIQEINQQISLFTENNTMLSLEVELLKDYLIDLNDILYHLNMTLNDFTLIPQAYKRAINYITLNEISDTVITLTSSSNTSIEAYRNIYHYITSMVNPVNDIDFPYISGYKSIEIYNTDIIQDINISTIHNYVQTPSFTLKYGQGDCDDQAVLAYAMIGCYHRTQPTNITFYLASLYFGMDSEHYAVFVSSNQGLLIIDPFSLFFTSQSGQDSFRDPQLELSYYNTKWIANGGITEINLYSINISDGSTILTFSGDLSSVINFLN